MIEFDCEGCGVHVVDLGSVEAPASRLCATCERIEAAYKVLRRLPDKASRQRVLTYVRNKDVTS